MTAPHDLNALTAAVQRNCHISDSRYAQNYGMCTYLLKMRELYRWEKQLPLGARLEQGDIGTWLEQREALWESLEAQDFACIPLDREQCVDPFDAETVNRHLRAADMVYSGGYGNFCKPQFFLAELEHYRRTDELEIYIAGREHARDLTASPAMSQGTRIFIRRESVRRALWERVEEWQWHKAAVHTTRLLQLYAVHDDLYRALERMTEDSVAGMIAHETGEVRAHRILGPEWEDLLVSVAGSKAELAARAVRDHLADCLVTLPELLAREHEASLLLFFANLEGMRKSLFPSLAEAYHSWLESGEIETLRDTVARGREHWHAGAEQFLRLYREAPGHSARRLAEAADMLSL